jgi:histidinol dehydrogenase
MFKIFTPQEAEESILKRVPLDDFPVSSRILDGIEAIFGERLSPDEAVRRILHDVRTAGDAGLQVWSAKLDGLDTSDFRVPEEKIRAALDKISAEEREAIQIAAERIRRFYRNQPLSSWIMQEGDGTLGQLVRPIRRVGIYVPGGTAPLPSTVLMAAIPAQVAGVGEIAIAVPPERKTGEVAPITLAAAALLGLDEVYTLGGAQAIGALAFGTETIPAVDKIYGPGNLFVTLAKRQVYGTVGIDGLAGPTETMVIADETANPEWVAADLLAQAEHDVLASAVLLTSSEELAGRVQAAVGQQIETLPRAEITAKSLANRSGIVLTKDLAESVELANAYAPEHLCLAVTDPFKASEKISAAGGIFIGEYSCEVLGDYVAGPSHVMPTSGTARFASPLNLWDFVHLVSLIALDGDSAAELSGPAGLLARSEGLEAHARAADCRGADLQTGESLNMDQD